MLIYVVNPRYNVNDKHWRKHGKWDPVVGPVNRRNVQYSHGVRWSTQIILYDLNYVQPI